MPEFEVSHIKRQAVVLTAISSEFQAVQAHLTETYEVRHPQGTIYEQGHFICPDQSSWSVGIVQIGSGNTTAAFETERAVNFFKPSVLLFVGVAGGLKDVRVGDVVAATKVYGYESGKSEREFEPRPDVGESSYPMVQRALAEARRKNWLERLNYDPTSASPCAYVGAIAAGEKVIASKRSEIYRFLRSAYGDALAVEMEGRGFLRAAHAHEGVNALIVRGISDLLDGKSGADSAGYQEVAAHAASAFAFEVLANLESSSAEKIGQFILVFSGTIQDVDKARAQAIVSHLREISKDVRLTLTRIKEGSVVLVLKGSREGFERIEAVFKSGRLSELLELDVIYVGEWTTLPEQESGRYDVVQSTQDPIISWMRNQASSGNFEHTISEVTRGIGIGRRRGIVELSVLVERGILGIRMHGYSPTNYYYLATLRGLAKQEWDYTTSG